MNKIRLRMIVNFEGDRFAVTYLSRRPHLGHGLYLVLENPTRGLKIRPYKEVLKHNPKL